MTNVARDLSRTQRLTKLIKNRLLRRSLVLGVSVSILAIAAIIPLLIVPRGIRWLQEQRDLAASRDQTQIAEPAVVFLEEPQGDVIAIPKDRWSDIGVQVDNISLMVPAKPLTMDGVLYLDPDDYVPVRTRFGGEVVEIAQVAESPSEHRTDIDQPSTRGLRFGDDVKKGQILAVVWSRELGEKKSELAETISALEFDRETLNRLRKNEGVVPVSLIREAERRVRQGEISLDRIEKTLRSWQLSVEEIQQLRQELENSSKPGSKDDAMNNSSVSRWAKVELHSPIDGTIVEKNISVGALVDNDDSLFKVANLNHLDVRAFAYEEDISALQQLAPEQRNWTIKLKGDHLARSIEGVFDRIGNLIDPIQHTGLVMGWVDNRHRDLRAGQFVTASVTLPETHPLLSVPATSIADMDGQTFILVEDVSQTGSPLVVATQFDAATKSTAPNLGMSKMGRFLPIEVRVDRYQDKVACIEPESIGSRSIRLNSDSRIISTGAVEILAEYRTHLRSKTKVTGEVSR